MAVALSTSPNSICAVDEPIAWGITISDLGITGVTQKSIGFQLVDSIGNIIAESEIMPVSTSYVHIVDLRDIIRQSLITKLPPLFSSIVQNADGKELYTLKYGEITLTLLTGIITGFPLGSSSAAVTVVNTANNSYIDVQDVMTSFKILTYKPFQNYFTTKSFDWFYIWGASTITIIKNFTGSAGGPFTGTTVTTLTSSANVVNCVPIGYRHHVGLSGLLTYMVKITTGGDDQYYQFSRSCEPEINSPSQIVYFDPGGGYTSLDGIMINTGSSGSKDTVNIYKPYNSRTTGGQSLVNGKIKARYTFKRQMTLAADEREQLLRFAAAENYYIPLFVSLLGEGLVKFTFDDDVSSQLESLDYINLSGSITHQLNSANARE